MTQIRFDQLAKQYLEAFLEPLGTVQRHLEVPGESKFIDIWFTPDPAAAPLALDLGILSRIATTPCLLEPFRNPPSRQETRSCLLKLLWMQEQTRRQAKPAPQPEASLPKLWILASSLSKPIVTEFGGQLRPDWLPGIYFLPEAFKTVLIAINELPATPETLWLRILGRDAIQQQAIAELLAFPIDDPRRSSILELLISWRITLELTQPTNDEEERLMVVLSQAYLDWQQKTKQQGREEGREEGERSLVFRLLARRVGELPEGVRSSIESLSVPQLEALAEALLDFANLSDLEQWLTEHPIETR